MQDAAPNKQAIHPWVAEGLQKIRVGIHFLDNGVDWKRFSDAAQAAEELGYDSIWVPDHPALLPDCWGQLGALAAITRTLRLGTFVDCIFFRHPLSLARVAGDVDRWSGGRLVLGLGIGDLSFEFEMFNMPFLSTRERQNALEETIQILRGVWETPPFSYTGKHFQVQNAALAFGPVQQPYIPLLIAGGGERVTLRQVAQYADASNFGPHMHTGGAASMEDVVRKSHVISDHCATFGRPGEAILRTHTVLPLLLGKTQEAAEAKRETMPPEMRGFFESGTIATTVDGAIAYYNALVQAGMQYFIIGIAPGDLETMQMFKEQVFPALTQGKEALPIAQIAARNPHNRQNLS
jgi:alkanesulfonate monooxygenase SsuD/methylene tetrahydromethanopterin reductase-like flavin-dependent oxidoreductase (luciferase family)